MKAMSLGLIRGTVDEIDQTVDVTWVKSRVISREQVGELVTKIAGWVETVDKAITTVNEETKELRTQ